MDKRKWLALALAAELSGYGLLWYFAGLPIAAGVLLAIYGNSISRKYK